MRWAGLAPELGHVVAERVERAKADAAQDGRKLSASIKSYRIKDPKALIEIAKIAAAHDGGGTSRYIKNFRIKDQEALIEIAKIAAAKDGYYTSSYIQNYGIKDSAALIEIAKIAAAGKNWGCLKNYRIKDESALIEIAKIAAARCGHAISRDIQSYGIKDQAALIEIAKVAAKQSSAGISNHIKNYGIESEAALIEIAKIGVHKSAYSVSQYFRNFGIEDEDARIEIARTSLLKEPSSVLHIRNYDLPKGVLVDEITGGLHEEAFARKVFKWISANGFGSFAPTPPDWTSLEPKDKANHMTEWFSAFYKESTGRELPLTGTLEVQSQDVIYDALAATVAFWDKVDVERYGSRARATLAKLSGYDSIPTGPLSSNACRELWGVLFTARDTFGEDLATLVPVNFTTNKPQALRIVTLATALKGLGGDVPTFSEPIDTNKKFQAAEKLLIEQITEVFRTRLSIGAPDDPNAVVKLWERWGGDLTPFAIIAGRYRSNESWSKELPVLSEIAKMCLEDQFHPWRYRRDDKQLSMLSDQQLSGWMNNPCQISPVTVAPSEKDSAANSQLENLNNIFTTNLLRHLPQEIAENVRVSPLTPEDADALSRLSERAFSKRTLEDGVKLIHYALKSNDMEKICKAISLTNGAKGSFLKGLPDETKKQIAEDLASLKDATKKVQVADGTEYCVISVVTDDPKLLLMTGDLVQAASCQNYRSGSHIHTLPGYVIDGNIKLALSYVVKKALLDREGVKDYATLSFDPATQSLSVSGTDKRLPLGYAIRREVLRVGAVGDDAVCVIERPYLQNHAVGEQIAEHQRGVVAAHLKASGIRLAVGGETVKCPASRNPGGVYTDMGGGVKTGDYTIALPK